MGSDNKGFNFMSYPPEAPETDTGRETRNQAYKRLAKFSLSILFFFLVLHTCYDFGYNDGYQAGYYEGMVTGYITNKYITHDFANFSEENATNEETFLKKLYSGMIDKDVKD